MTKTDIGLFLAITLPLGALAVTGYSGVFKAGAAAAASNIALDEMVELGEPYETVGKAFRECKQAGFIFFRPSSVECSVVAVDSAKIQGAGVGAESAMSDILVAMQSAIAAYE